MTYHFLAAQVQVPVKFKERLDFWIRKCIWKLLFKSLWSQINNFENEKKNIIP